VFIAQRYGFEPLELFEIDDADRKAIEQAPKVEF
jgi:hypothetical protein